MAEVVKFSIPKSVKSNEPLFKSLQEMIVVTLMAQHLSINGAKKCGILNQSTSNCYNHIANLGKLFISGKVTLEDFLKNFKANTNISDGTLSKRTGKFLVRADGYDNYIPLITTSLNSKPETIIMKYEERFSIEMTFKELKSYLEIESNYFGGKESNYGYIFLLCLVYKMNDCLIEAILASS